MTLLEQYMADYQRVCAEKVALQEQLEAAREALREACLHQGLPEDAPPDRIATHFRSNRELREAFNPASEPSA